jgi:hypothetical protein
MKWSAFVTGTLFLIFTFFWMWGNKDLFEVEHHGKIVIMKIIDKPRSCNTTRVQHFMKVLYNGQTFSKMISGSVCEHYQVGDTISMRFLHGNDNLLFPTESVEFQYKTAIAFGVISLLVIIYSFFPTSRKIQ